MNRVTKQLNHQTKKFIRKARKTKTIGLPPGSLVHTGIFDEKPIQIHVYEFSENHFYEHRDVNTSDLATFKASEHTIWIQVVGVHDSKVIREIGDLFQIQALALEDVMNTHQRTKQESYTDYEFFVQNIPFRNAVDERFTTEQISLIAFPEKWVISFQERDTNVFDPVLERIRNSSKRIRTMGSPYLTYALLDIVVDTLFPILDEIYEEIERLEEEIITSPQKDTLLKTHELRQNLNTCRKCIWATREYTGNLIRDTNPVLSPEIKLYFRDIYDHANQLTDSIESSKEAALSLVDSYMNQLSMKMNEVMKILTIISTIFIPLSFIAGLYGMNFNSEASPFNMPELNWYLGYPFVLLVMLTSAGGLLLFFKRKNWF
ncbi:magnesium/cobalt transporter CorA [bacterium]|nr:MAG: magnesium/cobalt transporter CorA [bacterium]